MAEGAAACLLAEILKGQSISECVLDNLKFSEKTTKISALE